MKSISISFTTLASLLLALVINACRPYESNKVSDLSEYDELGQVSLNVTGTKDAQEKFNTGLLLLHSFEYEDAREAFLEAQNLDSTMVMAYWGEAMTHNHSLWQRQEKEKALKALNKLHVDPQKRAMLAPTDLEKDLVKAINILFGEGTKYERDITYENFMSSLVEKYPDNNEVKAFHAISLLASSRNGRDAKLYDKCAQIAQGIIKENPNHPGALHYLIHAYDDPGHASMAKSAADAYSKVAPDATHALHMPSHIYVALGLWDEVIKSNIASWNASVKKNNKSYHALNWLQYGLLQKNKIEEAKDLLIKMKDIAIQEDTKSARSYLIGMIGAQLVETNNWNDSIADTRIIIDDLNLVKQTQFYFIKGMKAYTNSDISKLKSIIEKIQKIRYNASLALGDKTFAMCSANGFASKPPNQLDLDMTQIMEWQLEARLHLLESNTDKASTLFEKATLLDETLSYSYGPPLILKPIAEDYGDYCLQVKKYEEAINIYNKSLKRNPNRLLSLQGKRDAFIALNDHEGTQELNTQIDNILKEQIQSPIL